MSAKSSVQSKHILFFGYDNISVSILKELDKYPSLKRQFILVDTNNKQIVIPEKVRSLNIIPVLYLPGVEKPVTGVEAISWLQNSGLQDKANGMDYGSFNDNSDFSLLIDENKRIDAYHQHFNDKYNRGYDIVDPKINSQYSKLNDIQKIDTYEEDKKAKVSELSKKVEQYGIERKHDLAKITQQQFQQQQPIQQQQQQQQNYNQQPLYKPPQQAIPKLPFAFNMPIQQSQQFKQSSSRNFY